MEPKRRDLLAWLAAHADPMARAIEHRLAVDADELDSLDNERWTLREQVRQLQAEATWQTR